jgi:undecaprenyl-diphosphatase
LQHEAIWVSLESFVSKGQIMHSVKRMVACEIALCETLNRKCYPTRVNGFFVLISRLGDGIIWYALMLSLPMLYGEAGLSSSLHMVMVGTLNLGLYKLIKNITGRERPCVVDSNILLATAPLDQYSFPSGHTMHAVAFSMVATAHHPELAWLLTLFVTLIGLSRIVLGLHYPSDVLAGALIGGTVALLFPWPP